MSDRDYYEVLGVDKGADAATLKGAYRKLAKSVHPDTAGGCETKFKELNEAYGVLSDPDKRAAYDRYGKAAFQNGGNGGGAGGGDPFDMFNDIFGDAFGDLFGQQGGGRRRSGPQRGADLRYDLEITLEDAFGGFESAHHFARRDDVRQLQGFRRVSRVESRDLLGLRRRGSSARLSGLLHNDPHLRSMRRARPDNQRSMPSLFRTRRRAPGTLLGRTNSSRC